MFALLRKNIGCLIPNRTSPLCNSALLLPNFSTRSEAFAATSVYDVLVSKHQFSPDFASAVASDLNRFRSPERADSVLTFLKENGFSSSQLERIVKYNPRILTASAEYRIKLKFKILKDFGFSSADIVNMSLLHKVLLHSSAEKKIIPQLSILKSALGSNDRVVDLAKSTPWFITANLERNMVPNLECLKGCGVSEEGVLFVLRYFPRCLLLSSDAMRRVVEKVKAIGFDQGSKKFICAVCGVATMKEETWEFKFRAFRDMGFSEGDTLSMLRRSPLMFSTSIEKIKAILKVVLATGRFGISDLVNDPLILGFGIEKRFKLRLRIIEILESRKLIKKLPSLSTICRLSHDKFFRKFVSPYADHLGEVCVITKDCLKSKGRKEKRIGCVL